MGLLETLISAHQRSREPYGGKNALSGVMDHMVEKRNAKQASDELIRLMESGNLTQPAIVQVMQKYRVSPEKAQQIFEAFKTSGMLEEMAQQKRLLGQGVPGQPGTSMRQAGMMSNIFGQGPTARHYGIGPEAEAGFTLAPGQKRFGPRGQEIASVPTVIPQPEKPEHLVKTPYGNIPAGQAYHYLAELGAGKSGNAPKVNDYATAITALAKKHQAPTPWLTMGPDNTMSFDMNALLSGKQTFYDILKQKENNGDAEARRDRQIVDQYYKAIEMLLLQSGETNKIQPTQTTPAASGGQQRFRYDANSGVIVPR